jgi:hypothetical protein
MSVDASVAVTMELLTLIVILVYLWRVLVFLQHCVLIVAFLLFDIHLLYALWKKDDVCIPCRSFFSHHSYDVICMYQTRRSLLFSTLTLSLMVSIVLSVSCLFYNLLCNEMWHEDDIHIVSMLLPWWMCAEVMNVYVSVSVLN